MRLSNAGSGFLLAGVLLALIGQPCRGEVSAEPVLEAPATVDVGGGQQEDSFVVNGASIDVLLNALSGKLRKPVVASTHVKHRKITGTFDLSHPGSLLRRLSERMALSWYDDGSSVYVYDNSEIKSAVISMQHASLRSLRDFLKETGLYDARFPVKGDEAAGTFYVSGVPIYVNLVTAAARYLDQMRGSAEAGREVVKVVPLHNSFVQDREFMLRDQRVSIPGIGTVIARIFGGGTQGKTTVVAPMPEAAGSSSSVLMNETGEQKAKAEPFSLLGKLPGAGESSAGERAASATTASPAATTTVNGVRIVPYSGTNSLVLMGELEKVSDIEALVRSLDVAKRQIELSLWIIDIRKDKLDQLGVTWQGAVKAGPLSIGFNDTTQISTLDGAKFLASVMALSQEGAATVVSRPVVLTQENVPAIFDSNQTFYTRLIGERSVQLEHVTYGTLVNVLPRLSKDAAEVEMVVDVEDGSAQNNTLEDEVDSTAGKLPLVNRTEINTVARVPREKSLLIGGNTRDETSRSQFRIPGLSSLPWIGGLFRYYVDKRDQVVRVFLIQPKLLQARATWQQGQEWESGAPDGNLALRATVQLLQNYMDK